MNKVYLPVSRFLNHQHNIQNISLFLVRLLVFGLVFWGYQGQAQTLPTGFSQVLVTNQLDGPTLLSVAPDGRLFVSEQSGNLRIIKNGVLLPQPFIRLNSEISNHLDLFGVAFDPDFLTNQYIYILYTVPEGTHNRISRFTANGDVVMPNSEVVLLDLDLNGNADTHFGGTMRFGPDGKLYVSTGDALNTANSQNLDSYHGKLLRLNRDGSAPADNPFTTGSAQKRRIWAYGLRNPHTISIQPGTGKLFVNDVGEYSWEEINNATPGGLNFGWPFAEGTNSNSAYANPLYQYAHGTSAGMGCAITGGTFFNPATTNYPTAYAGKYFFMDHCNNWIDLLTVNGNTVTRSNFATGLAGGPLALETGTDGNLYYLSRENNVLYKITYSTSLAPVITSQPQSTSVSEQNAATFRVTATGAQPFTYQWRKNGININGATAASYTINGVTNAHAGTYSVKVSNAYGNTISNNAQLTVTPYNQAPTASILSPAAGATYAAGTTISFNGNATDAENGHLAASAYTWYVTFHHNTHVHPGPSLPAGVTGGSFEIPNIGETSTNVFYRLYLVVTDPDGARDTAFTDILPRTSAITFHTNPEGLQLTLDGQPFTAPRTVKSVEGMRRTIGVVSPQAINNFNFSFGNWSVGGASTQTIATPAEDVTYTANFNYLKVNFQNAVTVPPAGWLRDFGQPFGSRTSTNQGTNNAYGWKKRADKTPVDLTSNGRKRSTPADLLLATLMHMQANDDAATGLTPVEGIWEVQVPNGHYNVTVAVGDGAYLNSKHRINVEGITAINNFVPTSSARFKSATVQVTVRDGLLTLDAIGGFNTKINTVTIQPAASVVTLKPAADAYVRNGSYANTNYGDDYVLQVESNSNGSSRNSYLKFSLNTAAEIYSAKLRVYLHIRDKPEAAKVAVYGAANDAWASNNITWNNAPAPLNVPLTTVTTTNLDQYYDFEVTDFVKAQAAGDKVASFVLKDPANQNTVFTFNSLRVIAAPPQLVLVTAANAFCGSSTLVAETFTSSPASNFVAVAGSAGSVSGGTYTLAAAATGSPLGTISIHQTTVPTDYTLTSDARVTGTTSGYDDFAILFNYQDKNNYYYASFNESNSATTHGIFKYSKGVVTQLADFSSLITSNTFYQIKIQKTGTLIKVYRNNVLQASVNDPAFTGGKVGLGSLNNAVTFDNFIVCAGTDTGTSNTAVASASVPEISKETSKATAPDILETAGSQLVITAVPNPSNTYFTLQASSSSPELPIFLSVADIFGRVVETRRVNPQQPIVIGRQYTPGTYIVQVMQGKKRQSIKLIKLQE